jgi:hypothetical protein
MQDGDFRVAVFFLRERHLLLQPGRKHFAWKCLLSAKTDIQQVKIATRRPQSVRCSTLTLLPGDIEQAFTGKLTTQLLGLPGHSIFSMAWFLNAAQHV